jgi:hypothetical protein
MSSGISGVFSVRDLDFFSSVVDFFFQQWCKCSKPRIADFGICNFPATCRFSLVIAVEDHWIKCGSLNGLKAQLKCRVIKHLEEGGCNVRSCIYLTGLMKIITWARAVTNPENIWKVDLQNTDLEFHHYLTDSETILIILSPWAVH